MHAEQHSHCPHRGQKIASVSGRPHSRQWLKADMKTPGSGTNAIDDLRSQKISKTHAGNQALLTVVQERKGP
jgi:hypothetical protein